MLIDQKLTTPLAPAITSSLNLNVYSTQNNGLLLSDSAGLAPGADAGTGPQSALPFPLLSKADGSTFSISNDQSIVVALSVDSDRNLTNFITQTDGFELILRDNNTSELSKVSFSRDGTQTAEVVLNAEQISALELQTRYDFNGDGTKAFRFENELLTSSGTNTQRLKLAQTSAGLAFVDNARVITAGQDLTGFPTPSPATAATNTNGLIQLLDSSFSIPAGTTPVYARQLVEWQTTTQFPAGTTVATGYELYTNNAGTVTRHSFATDGSLTSSDELSATTRQVAEMQVGVDLTTGTGNPSVSVNNRIVGAPPLMHDRALYQSNAGLLVSLRTDLETYATPFSTLYARRQHGTASHPAARSIRQHSFCHTGR